VVPEVEAQVPDALDRALVLARAAADDFRRFREEERVALLETLSEANAAARDHAGAGQDDEAFKALRWVLADAVASGLLDELKLARIAQGWSEREEPALALAWARANAAIFADSAQAAELEAELWGGRGDPERAREAWKRVQALDPESASAREALAGR